MKKIIFTSIFICLIITDIFLIRTLFKQKYNAFFSNLKNYVPFIKKDFTVYNDSTYLSLDNKTYKIIEGDPNIPTYTTLMFKAYVEKLPYLDKKLGYYFLPISIYSNNKNFKTNLILSTIESQKILINLSKKGEIKENIKFEAYSVKNVLSLLKTSRPVIIEVYFQKETQKFIDKLSNCNEFCKLKMFELSNLSKKTELFFKNINKNNLENTSINIGPTYSLIIYED